LHGLQKYAIARLVVPRPSDHMADKLR
jgi:hypothetical protein